MVDKLHNIIIGCQKNKRGAQEDLYNLFKEKMYGICLRYSDNYDEAEDILQDGFLKIFEKIYQYKFQGSFEGWMRKIMVNTALEKYRNKYKIINIQDSIIVNNKSFSEGLTDSLTEDELLKMIKELSPKYRTVFNLYAIEGYSHKEISKMLNITEGTSKSNLSRARMILQEKIKYYYKESIKISQN